MAKAQAVEKEEIQVKLNTEWNEFIVELRKIASEGRNSWRFLSYDKRKQQLEVSPHKKKNSEFQHFRSFFFFFTFLQHVLTFFFQFKTNVHNKHIQHLFEKKVDTLSSIHTKELHAWHTLQKLEQQHLTDWSVLYRQQQV